MATTASAGDAAAPAGAEPSAAPKLSLDILDLIKTAQAQNGLRHNDYERYRSYCARRLARVRACARVKLTQSGKGRKYVKKEVTPEAATDARHLQIPLVSAERAWADAQMLAASGDDATARTRNHRLNKLKRAVAYANQLQTLAAARGDARTALEAEAYAAFMRGSLAMETETWESALTEFTTARAVYEKLSTVASRRLKELFAARVEELAPMEKYSRWQQRRAGASESSAAGASELSTKIDAALAEAGSLGEKDGDFSHVTWRNVTVPIKNDKLKAALTTAWSRAVQLADMLAAQRTGAAASSTLPGAQATVLDGASETAYLDILTKYDEAARLANAEAARSAKEGKDAAATDAKSVEDFARFHRQRHVLDRNDSQIAVAVRSYHTALTAAPETDAAATTSATPAPSGKGKRRAPVQSPAAAAASAAAMTNIYAASPLQAALLGLGSSLAAAVTNAEAAAAATQVAAFYGRSMKTLDELITLAGGASASSAGAAGASTATGSAGMDSDLVAALQARREVYGAQRCFYIAVTQLANRKFSDATIMMHRAAQRGEAAMTAIRALPPGVRGKDLPAYPCAVDGRSADVAALSPAVVASGISTADVTAVERLLRLVSNETIKLQATALLEQNVSARLRPDGTFAEAWETTFGPSAPLSTALMAGKKLPVAATLPQRLERSKYRPTSLVERATDGAHVVPTADPAALARLPVAPCAVPFKPFLFDLAATFIDYPDSILDRASALETAQAKKPAAAAPARPPPSAAAAEPAAAASPSSGGGGGLFSWLTGR